MMKKVDLAKVFSTYCSHNEFMIIKNIHNTKRENNLEARGWIYNAYYNIDCMIFETEEIKTMMQDSK
jgi:hypothetical protein